MTRMGLICFSLSIPMLAQSWTPPITTITKVHYPDSGQQRLQEDRVVVDLECPPGNTPRFTRIRAGKAVFVKAVRSAVADWVTSEEGSKRVELEVVFDITTSARPQSLPEFNVTWLSESHLRIVAMAGTQPCDADPTKWHAGGSCKSVPDEILAPYQAVDDGAIAQVGLSLGAIGSCMDAAGLERLQWRVLGGKVETLGPPLGSYVGEAHQYVEVAKILAEKESASWVLPGEMRANGFLLTVARGAGCGPPIWIERFTWPGDYFVHICVQLR